MFLFKYSYTHHVCLSLFCTCFRIFSLYPMRTPTLKKWKTNKSRALVLSLKTLNMGLSFCTYVTSQIGCFERFIFKSVLIGKKKCIREILTVRKSLQLLSIIVHIQFYTENKKAWLSHMNLFKGHLKSYKIRVLAIGFLITNLNNFKKKSNWGWQKQ